MTVALSQHASITPLSESDVTLRNALEAKELADAAAAKARDELEQLPALVDGELRRQHGELAAVRCMLTETALCGWMAKQGGGNLSRAWKDRYFVLRAGVLFYFQSEDDDEPSGSVFVADRYLLFVGVGVAQSMITIHSSFIHSSSSTLSLFFLFFRKALYQSLSRAASSPLSWQQSRAPTTLQRRRAVALESLFVPLASSSSSLLLRV